MDCLNYWQYEMATIVFACAVTSSKNFIFQLVWARFDASSADMNMTAPKEYGCLKRTPCILSMQTACIYLISLLRSIRSKSEVRTPGVHFRLQINFFWLALPGNQSNWAQSFSINIIDSHLSYARLVAGHCFWKSVTQLRSRDFCQGYRPFRLKLNKINSFPAVRIE